MFSFTKTKTILSSSFLYLRRRIAFIIPFLLIVFSNYQASAHGQQVAYCVLNNGFIRVYIEHWHGDLTLAQMLAQNNTINVTTTYGSTTTTQNLNVTGVANNTGVNNLPGCGSNITVISACGNAGATCTTPGANKCNDWGYWDFAPAACGVPVSIRINAGNTVVFAEACPNLYPATVNATFNDNAPPVINCPAVVTRAVDCSRTGANINFTVSVADACDPNPTVTYSHQPGSFFPVGTTTVTVTATDNTNQTSTCSFPVVVSVRDSTKPKITCPPAQTVQCAGDVPAPDTASVSASDNCGTATVTWEGDAITPGDCANRFTITRTYRATDPSGNSATCTQTITVNDNTAPVITCPQAVTVQCAGDVPAPDASSVTATDNCGIATVTHEGDVISDKTCDNRYTLTRTYKATDACGNTATCTQTIKVYDDTDPVITCPENITVNPTDLAGTVVNYPAPSASDNCGSVTVTQTSGKPGGSIFSPGTTTNTFVATDACGNTSSCSFTVTVRNPLCDNNPNNQKVYVCHNGQTICVSLNALQTHLAHGDLLGECAWYPPVTTSNNDAAGEVDVVNNLTLKAFPNPTNRFFTLTIKSMTSESVHVKVYDMLGREVFIASGSANETYTFGENFSKGNYLVRVLQADKQATAKLIKQ